MQLIGKYILSGRLQAITSVILSTLVSFLAPPFAFLISGSVVGLLILVKGFSQVLQILIISWIILQIFFLYIGIPLYINTVYMLTIWLPILFLSMTLRITDNQGTLVLFAGIFTTLLVIVSYFIFGDVSTWWQERLNLVFEQTLPSDRLAEYQQILKASAGFINAMILAGLMLNILMSTFFARWWQSKLFNPGGFRKEFYDLRIPVLTLPVFIIALIMVSVINEPWQDMFKDILVVLVFMYLIQGISFAHRTVDKLKLSVSWLIFLYCILMLTPQMGLLIACLGIVDVFSNWNTKNQDTKKES